MSSASLFRPPFSPAREIFDAFAEESSLRESRSLEEWQRAEREAVFRVAVSQAERLGLTAPSMADVEWAEQMALGYIDYGSKWAAGIAYGMSPLPECPAGQGGAS